MTEPAIPEPGSEGVLAGELALGLLSGTEQAQATRQRLTNPALAREVEVWEESFAALADATTPVPPPSTLWPRLLERLEQDDARGAHLTRLQRSLLAWQVATAVAASVAACLVVALPWRRAAPSPPAPMLTARLSASANGPAVFVALYDPARRAMILTPAQIRSTADRSPELWLIPPVGRPVALGVVNFASSVQLASAQSAKGLATGALAISIEPAGGSPTGQPTGPVIAKGQLSRL
jgi:anti-sigma-K factor RskA